MARASFTTPIGSLAFPTFIDEPDATFADETDANDLGDYKARIRLKKGEPSTEEFIAKLQGIFDQHVEETKARQNKKKLKMSDENLPWADEVDRETDEETGYVVFRTKLKARVTKKAGGFFDQRPKVYSLENELLSEVPRIGPGSEVRLAGEILCWYNPGKGVGMSLWCQGVQ